MSYYILGHEVDSKESLSNNREKSIRKKTFALIAGFHDSQQSQLFYLLSKNGRRYLLYPFIIFCIVGGRI